VQPTNNHAERGLRGAVIARKLHAYLIDLLGAHSRRDPLPLLT
jgi:hypothetical protein